MPWTLWGTSAVVILVAAVALFLIAAEAGFRLGTRRRERSDESAQAHAGTIQSALLALLGLLLAFTFAMAVSRFDTRKALVLEEANAIGTTALRARLLPSPQRQEVAGLLKEYVAARLTFYDARMDPSRLEAAGATASRLQERLWAVAVAAGTQDPRSVPAGLFIQSLNEVIGSNLALALPIALVLVVILDIDRPRRGLIRVSQESMIRLKATLDQAAP